ncbi:Uncharacterized protein Rs2_02871 [Raphanus sativus]|nr:Uncharacterized protein Rs2_02871 [Raphanus sativus]
MEIKQPSFRIWFGDYESLLGLNNTKHASTSLSGVIGELTAVRSTVSDIPQGQERIKIDRHCSWMSPQEHMYLSTRKLMQGILFFMTEINDFVIISKPQIGWCYVSCFRWTKNFQRTVSSFTCVTCNNLVCSGTVWRVSLLDSMVR